MGWQTVAKGNLFQELQLLVEDRTLDKGDKIRAIMQLKPAYRWIGHYFDFVNVEPNFQALVPEGVIVTDVYNEGDKVYVDMEADPVQLAVVLAWIAANWLAIVIVGFVLSTIMATITLALLVVVGGKEFGKSLGWAIGIGAGLIGLALILTKRKK